MLLSMGRIVLALCAVLGTAMGGARAQQPNVAPTPPLGWNSWDSYGLTITEAQFRANTRVLRDQLAPFGWNYDVIDEGWYFFNPRDRPTPAKLHYALDAYGRFVPVPLRFPSAGRLPHHPVITPGSMPATTVDVSFAPLAAWVHAQGLKFGIHIIRGIPKASTERNLPIEGSPFHAQDAADTTDSCPWDPTSWGVKDNAAGQAWYEALLRQYAGWGVDFIKVDCIAEKPYRISEIRQIRRAIDKTGRPMVLSLSPGPTQLAHAAEVTSLANMWRISDDVWDRWQRTPADNRGWPQTVKAQFALLEAWEPWAGPNHWPDADMLPFGHLGPAPGEGKPRTTRLTMDEQRTMITLWAMARSPLIVGANLTQLDANTLALLTNRDLLRIDQTATHAAAILHEGDLIVWRAELPGGEKAIALFNTGETEINSTRQLADFGADLANRDWAVRNLWGGGTAITGHEFVERIPPHGCVLLMLQ